MKGVPFGVEEYRYEGGTFLANIVYKRVSVWISGRSIPVANFYSVSPLEGEGGWRSKEICHKILVKELLSQSYILNGLCSCVA